MFTGIITDLGTVQKLTKSGDTRIEITTSYDMATVDMGASISCNGACLTVVDKQTGWFAVDASDETLRCTTLGDWKEGDCINLERALKAGDELGGHIVTGHVDGIGAIEEVRPVGDSHYVGISVPEELASYVAAKGSIAVDGVSLTVNTVDDSRFSVNIIPHTWEHTVFYKKKAGDVVNLEIDILARYIARAMAYNK
jgi:riboflavin synthase